jgi:Rps23 Pro-64 3,4-dihydroxylase Tpa1-like proline 4-hydroxylase
MKEKILTTSSGDNIYIYDDVFDYAEMQSFKGYADRSFYGVLQKTIGIFDYGYNELIQCSLSEKNVYDFGLLRSSNFIPIYEKHFSRLKYQKSWFVMSNHSTKNFFHSDSSPNTVYNHVTLIYYLNLQWNLNDGGETLFCDSKGDVEIAVSCKPNRLIVYNSEIAHKASSQDVDAKMMRNVFVCKYSDAPSLEEFDRY